MSTRLNTPYGGELVQNLVQRANVDSQGLQTLVVNDIIESEFLNIATGIMSPLRGFMNSRQFQSVCQNMRLADSELAWTVPVVFDISEEEKKRIEGHSKVFLKSSSSGSLLGWIEPEEIFPHDKELRIRSTFGVTDESHPGVRLVRGMGPYLLAGKVMAFHESLDPNPLSYPAGVRERLTAMGLEKVTGFQTRNVVHRAHEYLQRVGLEVTGGLLVHPVIGWKKSGDFRPEAVQAGYRQFIDSYFPKEKVLLAFLKLAMRYAGPKEAVLHAIIRKNFGCSHFIVGRDHAGVGGFYSNYAAHEIFATLPPLGIEILKLREPFYCRRCEGIATDRSCGHPESDREYISGTKIRKILSGGDDPSHHIFRPEVLQSIQHLKDNGGFFYE